MKTPTTSALTIGIVILLAPLWIPANALVSPSPINNKGRLSKSTIEFKDPKTQCDVVLLGCIHGSQSSSDDVRALISDAPTDAVVLELCQPRMVDLIRYVDEQQHLTPLEQYSKMVSSVFQRQEWPTLLPLLLVSAFSFIQTELSGLRPWYEFATAKQVCEEEGIDVFLADQTRDDTYREMRKFPQTAGTLLTSKERIEQASRVLNRAFLGEADLPVPQLSFLDFITRSSQVVTELFRYMAPFLPILLLTGYSVDELDASIAEYLEGTSLGNPSLSGGLVGGGGGGIQDSIASFGFDILACVFSLALVYTAMALPLAKIILSERDKYLTRNIKRACEFVTEQRDGQPGRVLVVLGFLHCNGIAKLMVAGSDGEEEGRRTTDLIQA
mmetsp:Transcript_39685/g.58904  ORF Transcript_39685/g.58904 Transcript_39685/m.58904 type:complete len:385 (-) Transcript_39685:31-1185(-)